MNRLTSQHNFIRRNEAKIELNNPWRIFLKAFLLILEYLTQFMEFQIIQAIYLWILTKNFTIKNK